LDKACAFFSQLAKTGDATSMKSKPVTVFKLLLYIGYHAVFFTQQGNNNTCSCRGQRYYSRFQNKRTSKHDKLHESTQSNMQGDTEINLLTSWTYSLMQTKEKYTRKICCTVSVPLIQTVELSVVANYMGGVLQNLTIA